MKTKLKSKIERIDAIYSMLVENASTYEIAKGSDKWGAIAGTQFPKNSNISKTSLKNQIVTLRNELLLLNELL